MCGQGVPLIACGYGDDMTADPDVSVGDRTGQDDADRARVSPAPTNKARTDKGDIDG